MAFDFKKEQPELYRPKTTPGIVTVPAMRYVAVRGQGDPNDETGEYKAALSVLYSVSYTLRMSGRSGHVIDGFFDYVVPPLEGFWWADNGGAVDLAHKEKLEWISAIRLPDFVTSDDLDWAILEATKKKKLDCSSAHQLLVDEGTCVQCMHVGPYDTEARTIASMCEFAQKNGYDMDYSDSRRHHEVYLSNPERSVPDRLRTVIRLPIRKPL